MLWLRQEGHAGTQVFCSDGRQGPKSSVIGWKAWKWYVIIYMSGTEPAKAEDGLVGAVRVVLVLITCRRDREHHGGWWGPSHVFNQSGDG